MKAVVQLAVVAALFLLVPTTHGKSFNLCPRVECTADSLTCDSDEKCANGSTSVGSDAAVKRCCSVSGCCTNPASTLNVTRDCEEGQEEGAKFTLGDTEFDASCDGVTGDFSPLQCASFRATVLGDDEAKQYCWCSSEDGRPLTEPVLATMNLSCTCRSSGIDYRVGDSFPSEDGCNQCFCGRNDLIGCTLAFCDICTLPPVQGPCKAALPRYYYDANKQKCDNFVYGGCGGNGNRFETLTECYKKCGSDSPCTQPVKTGPCEAAIKRYYYNSETNACEVFTYGGCDANDNNFETVDECGEACQAGYYHPCSLVLCAYPTCAFGVEPIFDYDVGCCPFCPNEYRSCPPVRAVSSTDAEVCPTTQKSNCTVCLNEGDLCCRDACGNYACTPSIALPYYKPEKECPTFHKTDILMCDYFNDDDSDVEEEEEEEGCYDEYDCEDGELCCVGPCGVQRCIDGINPEFFCPSVKRRAIDMGADFVPVCIEDTGSFAPVQCVSIDDQKACFCVDVISGVPLSNYTYGEPDCEVQGCEYDGRRYYVGDDFEAQDGCNTCFCSEGGIVGCTEIFCENTCTMDPEPGPCDQDIPAYYYDFNSGECRKFTYSGCGGNENKFKRVTDCLKRCRPYSDCLTPPPKICSDDSTVAGYTGYYFNTTTGMCEFAFNICEAGLNFFEGPKKCLKECDPTNPGPVDSTGLPCYDIACDFPVCPDGQEVTYSDLYCCPFCSVEQECRDDEFSCISGESGKCLPLTFVCDGLEDCPDGEDEYKCDEDCPYKRCSDGSCYLKSDECDGRIDCPEREDERFCIFDAPYIKPVAQCPEASDLFDVCENECFSDRDCQEREEEEEEGGEEGDGEEEEGEDNDDNEICCPNSCGYMTCTEGRLLYPTPFCQIARKIATQQSTFNGSLAVGAFIPQCDTDGNFNAVQCWGSTGQCWCVNRLTGEPVSEPARNPDINCEGVCTDDDGKTYSAGDEFSKDCNKCFCSAAGAILCTTEHCPGDSCQVLEDRLIEDGEEYVEECFKCECRSGELKCSKDDCTSTSPLVGSDSVTVTMRFSGDFDRVTDVTGLEREVMRVLLEEYGEHLDLRQSQIRAVKTSRGSIVVDVELDAGDATSGANLDVLSAQMEDDYNNNRLVIKHEGQVLEPNGDFSSSLGGGGSGAGGLVGWQIAVIVIACVVLVILVVVLVVVAVVIVKGRKSKAAMKDYDPVVGVRKGDEDTLELKKPL